MLGRRLRLAIAGASFAGLILRSFAQERLAALGTYSAVNVLIAVEAVTAPCRVNHKELLVAGRAIVGAFKGWEVVNVVTRKLLVEPALKSSFSNGIEFPVLIDRTFDRFDERWIEGVLEFNVQVAC